MNALSIEGRVLIRHNFYVYAFDVIALQLLGDVHDCQGQSDAARLALKLGASEVVLQNDAPSADLANRPAAATRREPSLIQACHRLQPRLMNLN